MLRLSPIEDKMRAISRGGPRCEDRHSEWAYLAEWWGNRLQAAMYHSWPRPSSQLISLQQWITCYQMIANTHFFFFNTWSTWIHQYSEIHMIAYKAHFLSMLPFVLDYNLLNMTLFIGYIFLVDKNLYSKQTINFKSNPYYWQGFP